MKVLFPFITSSLAVVFDAIREMMNPPKGKKQPIGFVHGKGDCDE
ncbi:hypothetical protein [Mariprofundus erugo]|nr:hypothetical protein [Mariprofundus erugo]